MYEERRRRLRLASDAAEQEPSTGPASSPPARVRHPVTRAPSWKCYRVVRHYRQGGVLQFEDIGAFHDAMPALTMLTREVGKARILDPQGKVYADNWQPIEERASRAEILMGGTLDVNDE